MNKARPVFLLSGGRGGNTRTFGLFVRAVLQDISTGPPVVAYIGAASGDSWAFYKMIASMIKSAGPCQVKRVVLCSPRADLEKARGILQSADAVFMSGGDVEDGMRALEEKKMVGFLQELYQQGKAFFGASAGSIMMAKEWVRWRDPDDDATAEIFPCLDLAPIICDTHGEADNWEELQSALKLEPDNTPGYGITTGTCLKVSPDGKLEALGGAIAHYIRRPDKVERLSDLVPEIR